MLRSLGLADLITLANGASGTAAILFCFAYVRTHDRSAMNAALACFPVSLVCDVLDGLVARARHRQSLLGPDLDSLADVVSFGVAPAVLAFALGLDGGLDAAVLIGFVCCGISRLARFNATMSLLSDAAGKVRYYEGAPIPTSVLLVLLLTVVWAQGHVGREIWLGEHTIGPWRFHPLVLFYALSGSAMVSARLRIPKL